MKFQRYLIASFFLSVPSFAMSAGLDGGTVSGGGDVAIGPSSYATGNSSTAVGAGAEATSQGSTAVGLASQAGTLNGDGSAVLVITPGWSYTNQTAIGYASQAWGASDTALGTGAIAVSQPALGGVTSATAVGNAATVWGNNSVAIGNGAVVGAGAVGSVPTSDITISNSTAVGGGSRVTESDATALGANATASAANSVALGAGSTATRVSSVEVGGRQITGLAAGTAPTDAVNVQQLNDALAGIGGGGVSMTEINRLDGRVDQLEEKMKRIARKSAGLSAIAMAAGAPGAIGKNGGLTVGVASADGQQGIAASYTYQLDGGQLINLAGGVSTGGGSAVRAAFSLPFDPVE